MTKSPPENPPPARRPSAWWWMYACILAVVAYLVVAALLPAFNSPRSRLYGSSLGYPAMMRHLGQPIKVAVKEVGVRNLRRTIAANGAIIFEHEVPVRNEVLGIVSEILVTPGATVKRGDLLARINTGGYDARVAALDVEFRRAEVQQARIDYERERKAFDQGLVSKTAFDPFEQGYERAKVALQKAQEVYELSTRSRSSRAVGAGSGTEAAQGAAGTVDILATVSGTVFRTNVDVGQNLVSATENLMDIGDRLVFRAAFDQQYVSFLRVGDAGQVRLRAYPGAVFSGKVIRIDPNIAGEDPSVSRGQPPYTFYAWVEVSEAPGAGALVSGMNGYCIFEKQFSALAVSDSVLMRYSGHEGMVMAVKGGQELELRRVTYSVAGEGVVAIESGLEKGDLVVLDGQLALRPGDKVSVRYE